MSQVSYNLELEDIVQEASRQELLDLVELTDRWSTVDDSKFYLYQPNDIPLLFHMSEASTRFLGGGNRSSKTYSHVIDGACQFTGREPKSLTGLIPKHRLDQNRRIRFCMEDYPNSFAKVVWPYITTLIPSNDIQDVVKDAGRIRAITNKKGGFIEFMYYDQEVVKHQGTSRHAIMYDEEPPASIRDEGLMRLVDTNGEESFSLTPTTGLRYLYDDVVTLRGREVQKDVELIYNPEGRLIDVHIGAITDKMLAEGDPEIHVFYADIFDNKAINKEAAIRILNKFPKEEQMMRSRGYHMFLYGLIFHMFSDSTHLVDTWDGWKLDDSFKLYIAIDPHPRVPHAVLFSVLYKNTLILVDELFLDCDVDDLASAIKVKCDEKIPEVILIDPSAFSPDPIKKGCFAWELMDSLSINKIDSPVIQGSKDLTNGLIATKRIMTPNERGVPGLLAQRHLKRWRYEIARYTWDEWKKDTNAVKGEKQKPVDKDDHMMENMRRLVTFLSPHLFIEEQREEQDDIRRSSRVVGRNPRTGY